MFTQVRVPTVLTTVLLAVGTTARMFVFLLYLIRSY